MCRAERVVRLFDMHRSLPHRRHWLLALLPMGLGVLPAAQRPASGTLVIRVTWARITPAQPLGDARVMRVAPTAIPFRSDADIARAASRALPSPLPGAPIWRSDSLGRVELQGQAGAPQALGIVRIGFAPAVVSWVPVAGQVDTIVVPLEMLGCNCP